MTRPWIVEEAGSSSNTGSGLSFLFSFEPHALTAEQAGHQYAASSAGCFHRNTFRNAEPRRSVAPAARWDSKSVKVNFYSILTLQPLIRTGCSDVKPPSGTLSCNRFLGVSCCSMFISLFCQVSAARAFLKNIESPVLGFSAPLVKDLIAVNHSLPITPPCPVVCSTILIRFHRLWFRLRREGDTRVLFVTKSPWQWQRPFFHCDTIRKPIFLQRYAQSCDVTMLIVFAILPIHLFCWRDWWPFQTTHNRRGPVDCRATLCHRRNSVVCATVEKHCCNAMTHSVSGSLLSSDPRSKEVRGNTKTQYVSKYGRSLVYKMVAVWFKIWLLPGSKHGYCLVQNTVAILLKKKDFTDNGILLLFFKNRLTSSRYRNMSVAAAMKRCRDPSWKECAVVCYVLWLTLVWLTSNT